MAKNPLYVFEERHVGAHSAEADEIEGLHGVLVDYLTEIGANEIAEALTEAFEADDEDEFYMLVADKALLALQEVTDPELLWVVDDGALLLIVPEIEEAMFELWEDEEVAAANPLGVCPGDMVRVIEGSGGSRGRVGKVVRIDDPGFGRIVVHIPGQYESVFATKWQVVRPRGARANPRYFRHPRAEVVPKGVYEDEWYRRPIDPAAYGVFAFESSPPGRGEVQVLMPEGVDRVLRQVLLDSIGGDLIVDAPNKMTWLVNLPHVGIKPIIAAQVIRGWHEGYGRPGYLRSERA